MRFTYTILVYLAMPFVLCRLWWRGRSAPAYRQGIAERFGCFTPPTKSSAIWLHAVSLGEVNAAAPLIRTLLKQYPDLGMTITSMTPTGSQRIKELFGEKVFHVYVPYDLPVIINRFLRLIQPKIVIIMETELWPNLLYVCKQQQLPIVLANARLSEKSVAAYSKIQPLPKQMLQCISTLAAQAELDAERFKTLGIDSENVRVTGNIKFDIDIPSNISEQGSKLRRLWGNDKPVWIAASTHSGEDEIILEVHKKLKANFPELILILVPRHPERFQQVAELANNSGLKVIQKTALTKPINEQQQIDVVIGNTMGELLTYYAAADVAFVAGSLVENGGHNVLEPAALGIASITGPHTFNFTAVNKIMLDDNALICVNNDEELRQAIEKLLLDSTTRQALAAKALQVVNENKGSVAKHIQIIDYYLRQSQLEAPAPRATHPNF